MPRVTGILETVFYTANLDRAAEFYTNVMGLPVIYADARMRAYDVNGRGVFLLFPEGGTLAPVETPFGTIPPHDGRGPMHLAFSIPSESERAWRDHLTLHNIEIESVVEWPNGGTSLYFRDPDNHCLEVATPGLWPGY